MKTVNAIIFLSAMLIVINPSAGLAKYLSEEEAAQFEKNCGADVKCAMEYKKLKDNYAKYKNELDQLCQKDRAACESKIREDYLARFKSQAHCPGKSESCVQALNKFMAADEESMLASEKWCLDNPNACKVVTVMRDDRKKSGKVWCDYYSDICQASVAERKEKEEKWKQQKQERAKQAAEAKKEKQKREKALREQARENAKKHSKELLAKYQKELPERQKQADKKYMEEQFQCVGHPDSCIGQINKYMSNIKQQRVKRICETNKSACEKAKNDTAKNWCDENNELCIVKKKQLALVIKKEKTK